MTKYSIFISHELNDLLIFDLPPMVKRFFSDNALLVYYLVYRAGSFISKTN